MYCENCGNYLRDDDAFCEKCGTKNSGYSSVPVNGNSGGEKNRKSDKTKVIIVVAVFALLVIATVIGIVVVKKTQEKGQEIVNDLIDINPDGGEGEEIDPVIDDTYIEPEDDYGQTEEVSDYLLPESDSRYISESELYGFTAWECRVARNEIYARHGRIFKDEQLSAYFYNQDWYYPSIDPDDFSDSMLNRYEKANAQTIAEYEKEQGYR